MYRPASEMNDPISSNTLYIGLRWPITPSELTMEMAANR